MTLDVSFTAFLSLSSSSSFSRMALALGGAAFGDAWPRWQPSSGPWRWLRGRSRPKADVVHPTPRVASARTSRGGERGADAHPRGTPSPRCSPWQLQSPQQCVSADEPAARGQSLCRHPPPPPPCGGTRCAPPAGLPLSSAHTAAARYWTPGRPQGRCRDLCSSRSGE